jgi:hypothetical protein
LGASTGESGNRADTGLDTDNEQVLADTFRNLVRYALLKTRRNVTELGITPASFSREAMSESLIHPSNAEIFEKSAPSVKRLLEKAHGSPSKFHFFWKASVVRDMLEAELSLSYEQNGDLKVRLLMMALPEPIPVSPQAGIIDGRKPFEEAVQELLRVSESGRLAPYPPPL